MANRSKGSNIERDLLKKFTENNWRAVRVAGSGVNEDSPCDLIAGKKGRKKFCIECKSTRKNKQYITKKQIEDFLVFSEILGMKPVIALRFLREGWLFIEPKHLKDVGKNCAISLEDAKKKGRRFAQFFR